MATEEDLPLPVPISVPSGFSSNFINVAYENTEDKKDIGIYGAYVSSGTKYAVFYREASSGRFKYGYTTTLPANTVTSVVLGDIAMDSIIATSLQMSSTTASTVLGFDSSKNIASTKYPRTPSYGSCYINNYIRVDIFTTGVWYNTGAVWLAGPCSSEWSLATPTPNFGLKYTGPNAIAKFTYEFQLNGTLAGFYTLAIGSGTPVPIESAATDASGLDVRMSFVQVNTGDNMNCASEFIAPINTNDSVIYYLSMQDAEFSSGDTVSGGFSAVILEYV